jgi:hypothetical protein
MQRAANDPVKVSAKDSKARAGDGPDSFEAALKADAARIRVVVSPGLERRIEAALARERARPQTPPRRETFVRPWLAGSLVGLGVAAAAVLLIGRVDDAPAPAPTPGVPVADTSEQLRAFREQVPLNVETAELTAPLEQELRNLQSDLEKARENVERDHRLTF